MKIEFLKAKNGQYYFVVKARNGRVLVTSETYKQKTSAMNGAKSLANGFHKNYGNYGAVEWLMKW